MSNFEVLHQALDCFADSARQPHYFDLYDENIVLHGYPGVEPGLESVKRYYEAFWSAFPDARVKIEDVVEQNDRLALRFVIEGTHRGPFLNMAPTERTISLEGMTILQFRSGKCVARWSVTNSISLLTQLGVKTIPD